MCIYGGYKTQTVTQIANLLLAFDAKKISLRALRIYFAALSMVASREAAKRSTVKKSAPNTPRYEPKELSRLTTIPLIRIRKELRALKDLGLMNFTSCEIIFGNRPLVDSEELIDSLSGGRSEVRPLPIPRTVLRFLAKCKKASTIKTMLCYCVRGLSITRKGGEIRGKGCVKASWIASVMNLSERSVRSARADLLGLGFIADDEHSTQLKLNRTGAYFTINMEWKGAKASNRVTRREGDLQKTKPPAGEKALPVDSLVVPIAKFAPLPIEKCTNFAPLYKDKKTPNGSNNQKTQDDLKPAGVCMANLKTPKIRKQSLPFTIKHEALFSFQQVEALYFEACTLGLIIPSEATALNFLSAAVRARNAKSGDSSKIFAGIIRKKLWHHITQQEEEQARRALRHYRELDPSRFRFYCSREAA